MACLSLSTKKKLHAALNVLIVYLRTIFVACATSCFYSWYRFQKRLRSPSPSQTVIRVYKQLEYLHGLISESDVTCIAELQMDRRSFRRLCQVLVTRGQLRATRNVSIQEMDFWQTPEPIHENSTDPKWKWFKNCLGALDGTPVKVHVPECDKPKYITRKNEIATNVLGVCTPDMQFIYVLPGWEGSAHDGRVLRDAVTRRNGLKVLNGCYYLVDGGFTNGKGFLAPYRRTRYHLNEWRDGYRPTIPAEFFNMKHSSARNVIVRCFGLLKMRWGILRSPSFYDIRTHRRIISVCCMLHNFIRREMVVNPMEAEANGQFQDGNSDVNNYITTVESSDEWTA
ncbi:uncharacterized protein [Pyrus communis]|uniref:uncharacterized protein n=1 Tax=Pyrus communis TaxID=23211 RepID=UPI0035BFE44D